MSDPPENSAKGSGIHESKFHHTEIGNRNNEIAIGGEAYVVLDLPNDGAAEGVEIAVILEPPHHLRSRRPPRLEIAHGIGFGSAGWKPQSLVSL